MRTGSNPSDINRFRMNTRKPCTEFYFDNLIMELISFKSIIFLVLNISLIITFHEKCLQLNKDDNVLRTLIDISLVRSLSVPTFKPIIAIIIGDVHHFIAHCLIPSL